MMVPFRLKMLLERLNDEAHPGIDGLPIFSLSPKVAARFGRYVVHQCPMHKIHRRSLLQAAVDHVEPGDQRPRECHALKQVRLHGRRMKGRHADVADRHELGRRRRTLPHIGRRSKCLPRIPRQATSQHVGHIVVINLGWIPALRGRPGLARAAEIHRQNRLSGLYPLFDGAARPGIGRLASFVKVQHCGDQFGSVGQKPSRGAAMPSSGRITSFWILYPERMSVSSTSTGGFGSCRRLANAGYAAHLVQQGRRSPVAHDAARRLASLFS